MTKNEIVLFLEEDGFAEEKHFFEKTVIQNDENINLKAKFVENLFVLASEIRCEKSNISYSSDLGDELHRFSDMDKIINVITAFPILMKTFYKTEESTVISIKTHKGQSYHEIHPVKYTGYKHPYMGIRKSTDAYEIPPVSVSYALGFFMFTRRILLDLNCTVLKSELIFIEDLFDNRYKGKTLEDLEWKLMGG